MAIRPLNKRERYARPRLEAIQRFVGIEPRRSAMDTILSTVLFTDIVGSTDHQARLGDHEWKDLVEHHHAIVREALGGWRGVENDTAGDGFYATFDGPARAIHCAWRSETASTNSASRFAPGSTPVSAN